MPDDLLRSGFVDNIIMAEIEIDVSSLRKAVVDMQAIVDVLPDDLPDTLCSNSDYLGRPGSQLDDKHTFTDREGNSISAYPVIVDLRRLVQLSTTECVIKGISNQELLHAIVAMYDLALSEMTPDVLYATVCEKWARTIVLVRDIKETQESLNIPKPIQAKESVSDVTEDDYMQSINEETDTYECEDVTPSVFASVYSDEEEDEEDEEEESDEEDFSKGIGQFIKTVSDRREIREAHGTPVDENLIGIENRLLACATLEKKYVQHKDRVVHLTLITVRPRYRGFGLGKYLMSHIIDPTVVGKYEAIVVHADNAAIEFFKKFNFSDDLVLNSRWSELAEQFTNCTIMSFLPAFSGASLMKPSLLGAEMIELEHDFNKWRDKTLEAHQAQVSCVMRMKHEVIQLKTIVKSQSDLLTKLALENEVLRKEKMTIEKEFLTYRLSTASAAFNTKELSTEDGDGDISTKDLISSLQQQLQLMDDTIKKSSFQSHNSESASVIASSAEKMYESIQTPRVFHQSQDDLLFHDVKQQFMDGMNADITIKTTYGVTTVTKAVLPTAVTEAYQLRRSHLGDGSMVTDLYYCGSLERPERIHHILDSGFLEIDFAHGEYGRGLYFSKYPSKAAQFSAMGKLLIVEVGLGTVESVVHKDQTRRKCSDGYDSIITPGRLKKDDDPEPTLSQEYIVFDITQVIPVCLLEYEASV